MRDYDTGVLIDFAYDVKEFFIKLMKLLKKWKEAKMGQRRIEDGLHRCEEARDEEADLAAAETAVKQVSVSAMVGL